MDEEEESKQDSSRRMIDRHYPLAFAANFEGLRNSNTDNRIRLFWGEQPPFTPFWCGGRYFFLAKKQAGENRLHGSSTERLKMRALSSPAVAPKISVRSDAVFQLPNPQGSE
jgi:hypothetical protein